VRHRRQPRRDRYRKQRDRRAIDEQAPGVWRCASPQLPRTSGLGLDGAVEIGMWSATECRKPDRQFLPNLQPSPNACCQDGAATVLVLQVGYAVSVFTE
jgi:hypothetical protein